MSAALLGHALSLAGLGCLGWATLLFRRALAVERWPSVDGRVVAAQIEAQQHTDSEGQRQTRYVPRVTYAYLVAGERLEGHRVGPRDEGYVFETEAEDALARRPVGSSVQVHYRPGEPSDALLEPEAEDGVVNPLVLGAGLLVAGQVLASLLPRL